LKLQLDSSIGLTNDVSVNFNHHMFKSQQKKAALLEWNIYQSYIVCGKLPRLIFCGY